jgi:uncharacterized protein YaaQ
VRLVLAVVQFRDVDAVLRGLGDLGVTATQIEGDVAVGHNGLAAVIAGVDDDVVADVVATLHATARARSQPVEPLRPVAERAEFWIPGPIEQHVGGASVYVLPVRRFERIGYA